MCVCGFFWVRLEVKCRQNSPLVERRGNGKNDGKSGVFLSLIANLRCKRGMMGGEEIWQPSFHWGKKLLSF